jgi:hypothetical protein
MTYACLYMFNDICMCLCMLSDICIGLCMLSDIFRRLCMFNDICMHLCMLNDISMHLFLINVMCLMPYQGSKLAVAHGNQNVTWATWKRRKIAQLAIKISSSPVSLNYRLSVCIVIAFLLPVQLKRFYLKGTSVMAFQTRNQNV